jgi:hypothetical protein
MSEPKFFSRGAGLLVRALANSRLVTVTMIIIKANGVVWLEYQTR